MAIHVKILFASAFGALFSMESILRFFRYSLHSSKSETGPSDESFLLSLPYGVGIHELILGHDGPPVGYLTVEANRRFVELTGMQFDTLVAKSPSKLTHGLPLPIERLAEAFISSSPVLFRATPPLTNRDVGVVIIPLGGTRCVSLLFGQYRDHPVLPTIDHEYPAEAPADQDFDHQAIFMCAACPMVVVGDDTVIVTANGEARRFLDIPDAGDQEEKHLVEFVVKDDLPRVREFYHGLRANPSASISTCNCRFVDGDGPGIEVSLSAAPIPETPWIVVTLVDLTERNLVERTLRESEGRLRQLAANVDEVFWLLSPDHSKLLYVNPAYEAVFNRTSESLFDDPASWISALAAEDQKRAKINMRQIRSGSRIEQSDNEFQLERPDGSVGWIWMRTKPVLDAKECVAAYACMVTDITKSKQVEISLNRRLEEQMVLHTVAMTSAAATSVDSLIEHATLDIGTVLYPDSFGIMLLDEDEDKLMIHPSYRGIRESFQGQTLPRGQGVPYRVVSTGQPCRVPDVTVDPAYKQLAVGMRSELCVPMKAGDRVIGVINAESRRHGAYKQSDERLMMTFAGQLATAIERIRLVEAEHKWVESLEALRTTMTDISSELESEKLLHTIVKRAVELVGATGGHLGLLQSNEDEIEIVVSHNMGRESVGKRLSLGEGVMGRVAKTCVPLIVSDYQTWEGRSAKFATSPSHGVVAAPLLAGRHLVGVISISDVDPTRQFSGSDLRLLNMFAQQAAIAVENARLFREIQHLATTDPLTGLYNRRYFFDLAQREMDRARRYERHLAVLMVDLDQFKEVNDLYGHAAGDEVLRTVGNRFTEALRKTDILGRYGGEEFAAVLPETARAGARLVAEKLRECIHNRSIATPNALVSMTASVGIGFYDERCQSLDELMDRADQALYEAKRTGRDRVCVWKATR
jgi:diguanylate cyclase (GGDEF)-like protein/PAS domain S-box-containing protein